MTAKTSYVARHRSPAVRASNPRRGIGLFTTVAISMAGLAGVSLTALAAPADAAPNSGTIAGRVFEDYNANGAIDAGSNSASSASATDVGVPDAVVSVTDSTGTTVGTGASIADGTFSITVASAASTAVRVEITPPTGYNAGPHGTDSDSTVQFVTLGAPAASAVDVALSRPGDYSQPAPRILTVEQTAAITSNSNSNGSLIVPSTKPSLVSSAYSDRGTTAPTTEATADQTGTVWGVAQLGAKYGFSAASFKRHARTGPGGLGQIYLTDLSAGPNASQWVTIPDTGTNPRGNESAYQFADWFHDSAAFPQVGKIGLGGIAMVPDNSALYVVNLHDKNLYRVPITLDGAGAPQAGTPTAISLPTDLPGAVTGCGADDTRPYGVNAQNGALWVTLTCTGPGTGDLRGYVYRYDLTSGTFGATPAFETALSGYGRGSAFHGCATCSANWNAWPDDTTFPVTTSGSNQPATNPEPMLSSVVFDSNGDMTIGVKDRFTDQIGYEAGNLTTGDNSTYEGVSAGDTLRACGNATTGWTLESNANCGTRTGNGHNDNQGPGNGEFYEDNFPNYHDQVTLGGLLQLPGYGQVVSTAFDPGTTVRTSGVRFLSNTNGAANDFHQVIAPVDGNGGGAQGSFSKAGGLGALAALVTAAPIEIGNRVWFDSNYNGIQDAGEPAAAGVTVNLYAAGNSTTPLATAVTDSNGDYYFSSASGTSTASAIYGVDALQPDTDYTVALDHNADFASGGPLAGYLPTTAGAGNDTAIDSNGALVAGVDQSAVTTGGAGVDDHTIDFGFVAPTYAVGDYVWKDTNANGIQDTGEPPVQGVTVSLLNTDGSPATHADGTSVVPVHTDSAGHYAFDFLAPGTYRASFSTLPAGYVLTTPSAGTDQTADSNPVVSTGVTPTFDVGPTAANMRAVASGDGVTRAVAINPTIDAGLVPGPSVSVGDFVWDDSNHNGVQDSGEPGITGVTVTLTGPGGGAVHDIYGNSVGAVQTDSNGAYLFDNLPVLSADQSYTTHVDNSQSALTGYLPTLTGQGTASTDSSTGQAASGDLTAGGASDLTLDYGFVKPVSVGDFVWVDTNHNGVQDTGEPGVPGVVLTITDTGGNPVTDLSGTSVGSQTTDSQGAYHFTNLPPGQYVVHVDNSQMPLLNYKPTTSDAGTDRTKDSDSGSATSSVLASGGSDQSLDFGFVALTYAVGDYVWKDTNGNGIQDTGEASVAGVTVTLLDSDGVSPAHHADGTPVAPVLTDSVGHYAFDSLAAGSYTATFTTLPAGYVLTTASATDSTQADDSNPVVSTGLTPAFAVGPESTTPNMRAAVTDDGVTADFINPTIDAGLVLKPSVSVGDFVWEDSNHNGVQDSGEPGITGVTVTLTGPDGVAVTDIFGNPVVAVHTDSSGGYLFANLPVLASGESYTTHVDNSQPALTGYLPTLTGQGTASTDSSTGQASSGDLISGGASDRTLDYGFVKPVRVGDYVWVDTNHDGLQDAGEQGIPNVVLTITDTAGNPVEDLNGDAVGPQTTDLQGAYEFTNLPPGQYIVHVDNSQQALSAYTSTIATAGTDRAKDSETGSATSLVLASGGADETLDFGFVVPPPASGNGGQHAENPPAGGGSDNTTTTSSNGSAGLSETGAPVQALIWLALTALLGGLCLALAGRRRRA